MVFCCTCTSLQCILIISKGRGGAASIAIKVQSLLDLIHARVHFILKDEYGKS